MAGTFILRPTTLTSAGNVFYDGNAFPNDAKGWLIDNYPVATILEIAAQTNVANVQFAGFSDVASGLGSLIDTLRFNFSGSSFYLDGSVVPIPFSSLPAGFFALTASVKLVVTLPLGQPIAPGFIHYWLQQANGDNGTQDTATYSYGSIPPPILTIYNQGIGMKGSVSITSFANAGSVALLYDLRVEGTYETIINPSTAVPGQQVTVTDLLVDLRDVTQVLIGTTVATIFSQTLTTLVFIVPSGISGTFTVYLTTSGAPFSIGSLLVPLAEDLEFIDAEAVFRLSNQGEEINVPATWRLQRFDVGPRSEERS